MRYEPKSGNRKPDVASLVMLVSAVAVFFSASRPFAKGRALLQVIGVLMLTGAAYFMIKKVTSFIYIIMPHDGDTKKSVSEMKPEDLTFTVSKRRGQTAENHVCQLELSRLTETVTLPYKSSEKSRIIKEHGVTETYNYTVTFRPLTSLLLVFKKENGEKLGVVIEPDSDFKGCLEAIARMNKESK